MLIQERRSWSEGDCWVDIMVCDDPEAWLKENIIRAGNFRIMDIKSVKDFQIKKVLELQYDSSDTRKIDNTLSPKNWEQLDPGELEGKGSETGESLESASDKESS